jgi:putative peptidoglycan lipid II flippase
MSSSRVRAPVVTARPAATVGVAVVAWSVLLALVAFARWPALSWSVGATCLGTVYQAVNAVPTVLFDVAAGSALVAVGAPVLVGELGRGRTQDVPRLGAAVLTWSVVALGLCSVALFVGAQPVASALVGESGCAGAVEVATAMLRWFAPQPLLLGVGVVLTGILRAHGRLPAAGLGPAVASLILVGSVVWFRQLAAASDATGVPDVHLRVLAGGTTLAALALAVVPALVVGRAGLVGRPTLRVPPVPAGETRGAALAGVLAILGQCFAAVAAVVVTSRSGVGVLPVRADIQGVLLVPYAALLLPQVARAVLGLADVPAVPEPRAADPEATTILTRSARHRRPSAEGTLAWRARAAVAVGAMGAAAVAAAAGPVGGFFTGIDAARDTTQGRAALDAVRPGLWAGAAALVVLGLAGVLCAALYVRGRPFVAGGAVTAAWLIAGGVPLVAVMPGATPTRTVVVLGVSAVGGVALATLDLLAATSRAWGPGALAGLGRTLVVGVLGAAAGAAAGLAATRWWSADGAWANAGAAAVLAGLGALVTAGVLALFDRELLGWLWRRLRVLEDRAPD